ncbi:MAG: hypothetical protein E7678_07870 [Ruminococcaceae bacterium]|nr:hypothetical protein [Oscillospiraceae bacterium]
MKKRRAREFKTPRSERKKSYNHRFFALGIAFSVICTAFLIYLGVTQIKGGKYYFPRNDDIIKTETVYGERGRIFDRNGKLLVGNTANYNLIFEYGSMADKRKDVNLALLECLEVLRDTKTSNYRAEDYFPLTGTYPNMNITNAARDENTNVGYYFQRFLTKQKFSADTSPERICSYFVDKYKLWTEHYSNAAISELIRLYYDMERIDFGYYQHYTIAEGIDPTDENAKALIKLIKERSIEGTNFIKQTARIYPYDTYAAHILGRIGKITAENASKYEDYPLDALVGTSGCEAAFEEYLRGTDGKKISVYNKDGELVKEYYDPEPVVGKDVYLTIDIDLQIKAEDALKEEIERLDDSEAGAATFIDPNNGEVLVSASYPTYSQNEFSGVDYYASLANDENMPLLNRALQGSYAPGSVYKVGAALAALEQGLINTNTCYDCQKVYPYFEPNSPTCLGNHGNIDVTKAIEVSCNIFFYYVGHENGLDKITPYTKSLGLGAPTGIELGERLGIVASEQYCRDTERIWRTIDNATGAIGQSYHLYSPLQLSVYTSTIANGGTRYSAHFLKTVKDRQGNTVYEKNAKVAETVEFSAATHSTIKNAMSRVVSESSVLSRYFSGVNATVGGKTGTAQVSANSTLPDNALFSGFAPYDNPKIVGSCILEAGEQGSNAAKIVAAVFEEYFAEDNADA